MALNPHSMVMKIQGVSDRPLRLSIFDYSIGSFPTVGCNGYGSVQSIHASMINHQNTAWGGLFSPSVSFAL
jgi:hypothetical protein